MKKKNENIQIIMKGVATITSSVEKNILFISWWDKTVIKKL
jgi:hypothetical protein